MIYLLNSVNDALDSRRLLPSSPIWFTCTQYFIIVEWCTIIKDRKYKRIITIRVKGTSTPLSSPVIPISNLWYFLCCCVKFSYFILVVIPYYENKVTKFNTTSHRIQCDRRNFMRNIDIFLDYILFRYTTISFIVVSMPLRSCLHYISFVIMGYSFLKLRSIFCCFRNVLTTVFFIAVASSVVEMVWLLPFMEFQTTIR